tara:strand:+ start:205 stop:633 length:429 start_codon:yes stop_codon:yes gene_type:complete
MIKSTRKGYTQAIANLSSWKFLIFQILFFSSLAGIYFKNIYIFLVVLFCLTALFYYRLTAVIFSIIFSLLASLLTPVLISGINIADLRAVFSSLFSTPVSQVIALIIFLVTYYFNYSGSLVLREVLEPILKSFFDFFHKKTN